MCKNCKNKSCSGGCQKSSSGKEIANMQNELNEVRSELDSVLEAVRPFLKGHPILMLENALDIDTFSPSTGLGSEAWEGWAICNGATQTSPATGKDFATPNLLDRFVVAAGDAYEVGDTGGSNDVTLSEGQMPSHIHAVTDPTHSHDITDLGHNHAASSASHAHSFTSTPHTHIITVEGVGDHTHETGFTIIGDGGTDFNALNDGTSGNTVGPGGAHTHDAEAAPASVAGTVGGTAAAVSVDNAFVGITETETSNTGISIESTGDDEAHENRPPYYALLFVIKL